MNSTVVKPPLVRLSKGTREERPTQRSGGDGKET
ncbi:hypothetical protein SLEP1_g12555 [Rubroshorea leprosula]|uniref:Photosystem II phosphoprotein n=1 Tax=Rubroshorea leprosula TaxID=152421 RepID=A0AAV5IM29_9ROSI|nr:hypothetical protein SLEP1_g12555 [Rubroshorea leprosula]